MPRDRYCLNKGTRPASPGHDAAVCVRRKLRKATVHVRPKKKRRIDAVVRAKDAQTAQVRVDAAQERSLASTKSSG